MWGSFSVYLIVNDGVRPAGHGQPFLTRVNLTGFTNARYQRRRKALAPVLVDRQPRETQQPKEALSNLLNLVVLCQAIVKPCRTFVNLCRTIVEPLSNIVEPLSNFVEKMNTRTLSSVVLASFSVVSSSFSVYLTSIMSFSHRYGSLSWPQRSACRLAILWIGSRRSQIAS